MHQARVAYVERRECRALLSTYALELCLELRLVEMLGGELRLDVAKGMLEELLDGVASV